MNVCMSGGAEGADIEFGNAAKQAGMDVVHFTFKGHRSNANVSDIVILTDAELALANPYCLKANETLHRSFPSSSNFVNNLLRRNWYQIKDSTSCYAVSSIKDGMVQGGTAWATQCFLDQNNNAPCDCFVFCQDSGYWFKWDGFWNKIYAPPKPTGIFAGIGSRKLSLTGRLAIRTVF